MLVILKCISWDIGQIGAFTQIYVASVAIECISVDSREFASFGNGKSATIRVFCPHATKSSV